MIEAKTIDGRLVSPRFADISLYVPPEQNEYEPAGITLDEIKQAIRDDNIADDEASPEFKAAILLMTMYCLETINTAKITRFSKLPAKFVTTCKRHLKKTGIIVGYDRRFSDWFDERAGTIAFTLDCLAALGIVERKIKSDD